MAAYTQFGCGYPSAKQFLPANSLASLSSLPNVQSPIATTSNAPSLSPPSVGRESGGSSSAGGGTLTPDPISQTSASRASSAATGTAPDGIPAYTCSIGAPPTLPACCDNGRPVMTDPVSGQTVCSCQYDPARLALSSYTRIQSAASVGVYGTPYPSNEQNPYPSIGVESTPFYSTLSNPYALKDSSNSSDVAAWSSASLPATAGYYTYDPTFTAYGYGAANYDLASRRKNATRESTATLKAWLNEHKKNPYPTKGEKIMLAIITKMTLTQVSTWFANARRRLKKENKMTWEPKSRAEEDDDEALPSDEEREREAVAEKAEKRQRIGANLATGGGNHVANGSRTASEAGAGEAAASNVGVGGMVGSHNTGSGTGIEAGAGAHMSVGVGVISAQPKDSYTLHHQQQPQQLHQLQQPQQESQYSLNFYYNTSMSQQQLQSLQQQQQQHQQQQQSVLSALSQHVADSTLLHRRHQQQQHQRQLQQQQQQQQLPTSHMDGL